MKQLLRIMPAAVAVWLLAGLSSFEASAQSEETYAWKNVEIVGGGFVPGIIYNESEPGLVYARTDIGGAYRMDPATNRWIPLLDWVGWDDWGWTGIVSLATDPVDPNRLYLAAGTYTNSWDPKNGAILRSADRGNTFQISPLPFKLGGNMPGRGSGERLAVDPNDNRIVYFGAGGDAQDIFGLWRSTDYGATWSKVTNFPGVGDFREDPNDTQFTYLNQYQGIWWVVFDKTTGTPGSPTPSVYVGVATKNGPTIYHSSDGGASWAPLAGQPVDFPDADPVEDMHLMPKKAKHDPVNGYLYIAYGHRSGPYEDGKGDVWRYHTVTGEWALISPVANNGVLFDGDGYFGYNGLTIDRQNPSTIMVTGYSSWWPDTKIWRSTDFGNTWTEIYSWTRYPNRSFRYTQDISEAPWLYWGGPEGGGRPGAEVYPKLGWMTETLEIDPFDSNKMMYGTGATIYGSDNLTVWDAGGQITITVKAMGLEETAIQELVSPPAGPPLLSGMYDIYGFTHQDLNVVPQAFYPDKMATVSIDYAESNPSFIFRVGTGDASEGQNPSEIEKAAYYSTDSGNTWSAVMAQPTGVSQGGGTVAVNATGTRVVWAPSDAPVSYSANNGGAWTASSGIPQGAVVESDRVNANKFYGFSNGTFYASTDGGTTFTATVTSGLPSGAQFRAVPGREGHIWLAGYETGMWRSTDSGASFTNLGNVDEADNVGFGKAASGASYMAIYTSARVAGVRGIFRSTDEGATWVRINDDQHQYAWTGKTITGDPRVYGRVYIATNGRGIIYGDIEGGGTQPPPDPSGSMHVASIVEGSQAAGGGAKHGAATVTIVDDASIPVSSATVSGTFSGDFNETVSGSTGSDGKVTLVTTGSKKGGLNFTFCVDSVAHGTLAYDSASNVVTCSDGAGKVAAALAELPDAFALEQNYPNPFNPRTEIRYHLAASARVELQVYDVLGQLVETLVDAVQPQGSYTVALDARDLPSGTYLYRIQAGDFTQIRKMVLLK